MICAKCKKTFNEENHGIQVAVIIPLFALRMKNIDSVINAKTANVDLTIKQSLARAKPIISKYPELCEKCWQEEWNHA